MRRVLPRRGGRKKVPVVAAAPAAHLKVVGKAAPVEQMGTSERCVTRRAAELAAAVAVAVAVRDCPVQEADSERKEDDDDEASDGESFGGCDGEDVDNDDDDDEEEEEEEGDEEAAGRRTRKEVGEEVEEEYSKKLAQFFDLLQEAAAEDVRAVNERLRQLMVEGSEPPEELTTETARQVWKLSLELVRIPSDRVGTAERLVHMAAGQSGWGKCVMAAQIAGELLHARTERLKAEVKAASGRLQRACVASAAGLPGVAEDDFEVEDAARYFGDRMAKDVDEMGKLAGDTVPAGHRRFMMVELRRAYAELSTHISASGQLATLATRVAVQLDAEVQPNAAVTEDTLARYSTASRATRRIYPLVRAGGQLTGCSLPKFDTFKRWLETFLSAYREFILRGEMLWEPVVAEEKGRFLVLEENGQHGYRVRGHLQRDVEELSFEFWMKELQGMSHLQVNRRVKVSQNKRLAMKALQERKVLARKRAVEESAPTPTRKGPRRRSPAVRRSVRKAGAASKPTQLPDEESGSEGQAEQEPTRKRRAPRRACAGAAVACSSKRARSSAAKAKSPGTVGGTGGGRVRTESGRISVPEGLPGGAAPPPPSRQGDPRTRRWQARDPKFNYILSNERPVGQYFAVTMLKDQTSRPSQGTMRALLESEEAVKEVAKYVTVAAGAGITYTDYCSLTCNLHGAHTSEQRTTCSEAAEARGVPTLSIPGGGSYKSREVNVLYQGTAEFQEVMGSVPDADIGEIVQGMYQMYQEDPEGSLTPLDAAHMIGARGNVQFTVGICNSNYDLAKPGESGEIASPSVQGEAMLHKYFPNRGRLLGVIMAELARVRDALTAERGDSDREFNDELRNQIFSGRAAQIFGLDVLNLENLTCVLTGNSRTLNEIALSIIERAPNWDRERLKGLWRDGIETADHGDFLNPKPLPYGRVVAGKWRVKLERDDPGQVLVLTLIGNHRSAVDTYREKMKGVLAISEWYRAAVEERLRVEGEDHLPYAADGDYMARGAAVVRIGFLADEEAGINRNSINLAGPGGFVSYSRSMSSATGGDAEPWRRHRESDLGLEFEAARTAAQQEGGRTSVAVRGKRGRKSKVKRVHRQRDGSQKAKGRPRRLTRAAERAMESRAAGEAGGAEDVGEGGDGNGTGAGAGNDGDGGGTVDVDDQEEEGCGAPVSEAEVQEMQARSLVHAEILCKRADFNRYADLSGLVAASEELRDRFQLSFDQAEEVLACIAWHTRSRAVFLVKCEVLLAANSAEGVAFEGAARRDRSEKKRGRVGNYLMEEMLPSTKVARTAKRLVRAGQFQLARRPGEATPDFTAEFVAEQCGHLRQVLKAAQTPGAQKDFKKFLNGKCGTVRFVGQFAIAQLLPLAFLMGLLPRTFPVVQAVQAPILDKEKAHYKEFVDMGVEDANMDLTMLVVALQHFTVPLTVENTGCEDFRDYKFICDFMRRGQMFYDVRPVPGCNYRRPDFEVYMKKWGRGARWVKAVRDGEGRWRHP